MWNNINNAKTLTAALGIIFAFCERVESIENKFYGKVYLGYVNGAKFKNYIRGNSDPLEGAKAMNSPAYGGELGYQVNDYINLGIEINAFKTSFTKYNEEYISPFPKSVPDRYVKYQRYFFSESSLKIKSTALLLDVYYNISKLGNLTPYISAGIGMALHRSSDFIGNVPAYPMHVKIPGNKNKSLAWALGLGAVVDISNHWATEFKFRYFDYGKAVTQSEFYLNGDLKNSAGRVGTKINGYAASVGIVCKF